MLMQIRDYLRREKVATNQQLSRAFNIDISALEPMLAPLIAKGILSCEQAKSCKKACFSCQTLPLYYTYIETV